jgi:hypothetical protein
LKKTLDRVGKPSKTPFFPRLKPRRAPTALRRPFQTPFALSREKRAEEDRGAKPRVIRRFLIIIKPPAIASAFFNILESFSQKYCRLGPKATFSVDLIPFAKTFFRRFSSRSSPFFPGVLRFYALNVGRSSSFSDAVFEYSIR